MAEQERIESAVDQPAAKTPRPTEIGATVSQANASIDTSRTGAPRVAAAAATPVPTQFGRYKIERELGKGAMGVVYLAEDTQLQRKIALKIPKASVLEEEEALERFYREARTTATLRHNNICPVYDVGDIDGVHYLSMAYIRGKPVSSYLTKGKHPAARQVALLIRKIALALEEAHRHGIIHRDLKPSNVMLDDRGEPIVMDFGLACQVNTEKNARLTQSGAILGTPAYMAPEQVRGDLDQIGPQSDVYALGVMLYQFLAGELPFSGPVMLVFAQVLRDSPRRPSELRVDVDRGLEAICLKMIAKNRRERYQSMQAVADALTEYLKTGAGPELEETVVYAPAVADAEPNFDDLAEFPDRTRTARQKAAAKVRPAPVTGSWAWLRQQRWFWPATGALLLLPIVGFVAMAVWLSRGEPATTRSSRMADPSDLPPIDYAAERALAEFVLTHGGEVGLKSSYKEQPISPDKIDLLPSYDFQVVGVALSVDHDPLTGQLRTRQERFPSEVWNLLKKASAVKFLALPPVRLLDEELQVLTSLETLNHVSLNDAGVTNEQLQLLAKLPLLSGLRLNNCPIDNSGMSALNASKLNEVYLDGTAIDDAGLEFLNSSRLLHASLKGLNVSNSAVRRLIDNDLEVLTVTDTKVTDALLDALEPCSRLWQLDVRAEQVTAARVRKFSETHPRCTIYFRENGADLVIRHGAVSPATISPSTVSPTATAPVAAPSVDYAAERALAQALFKHGGWLAVQPVSGAMMPNVTTADQLPSGDFTVHMANLTYHLTKQGQYLRTTPVTTEEWNLLARSQVNGLILPACPLVPEDVARLAKCTRLTLLHLDSTGLTDDDLPSLLPLVNLNSLSLARTRLTNARLALLREFRNLGTLYLDGLPVNDVGLKSLGHPNLASISLWGTKVTDEGIRFLPGSRLANVNLNATGVTDVAVEQLAKPALEAIRLGNTGITDRTLDLLDNCRQLRMLDVRSEQVTAERVCRFAAGHPDCKIYFLADGQGQTIQGDKLLEETPPTLEFLDSVPIAAPPALTANPQAERAAAEWAVRHGAVIFVSLSDGQARTISRMQDLPGEIARLQTVNFGFPGTSNVPAKPITEEGWEFLKGSSVQSLLLPRAPVTRDDVAELSQISGLRYLSAVGTALTNQDLLQLTKLGNLYYLDLSDTQVNGTGLVALRGFRQLSSLLLGNLNLRDDDLEAISSLPIRTLDLSGNAISDAGLTHLSGLSLTSLTLDANKRISDRGIETLQTAALVHLGLRGTGITNRALDRLQEASALKSLQITQTKITALRAQKFANEHPSCKVICTEKGKTKTLNSATP